MTPEQPTGRHARTFDADNEDLVDYVANTVRLEMLARASKATRECLEPCLPHLRDAVELACPVSTLMAQDGHPRFGYGLPLKPGEILVAVANRTFALIGMPTKELPDEEELPDLPACTPASLWHAISEMIDDVAAACRASKPLPHAAAVPYALLARMGASERRDLREMTDHLRKQQTPVAMVIVGIAGTIGDQAAGCLIRLPMPINPWLSPVQIGDAAA
jgi:hypothetical protein